MNTDPYPTKFAEANALLAVQTGDLSLASEKLQNFMPNEVRKLWDTCELLAVLCREELKRRGLRRR